MSEQILCVTGKGIKTIRKNFKKRSEVKIKDSNNRTVFTLRFNNVELDYDHQYLNWENYNCCGGWMVDDDYLNHAVQNDRKLYAGILHKDLEALIPELESLGLCYGEESQHPDLAYICKPGCVADYIDVDSVLENYKRLGFEFNEEEIEYLHGKTHCPISSFSSPETPYDFDYGEPVLPIQFVFTGLLLGYTLESTAWIISQ